MSQIVVTKNVHGIVLVAENRAIELDEEGNDGDEILHAFCLPRRMGLEFHLNKMQRGRFPEGDFKKGDGKDEASERSSRSRLCIFFCPG